MTATVARPARKAVLTDLGDVLICDYLPAAAVAWGTRLGVTEQAFLVRCSAEATIRCLPAGSANRPSGTSSSAGSG
jgi:hypothetical protein